MTSERWLLKKTQPDLAGTKRKGEAVVSPGGKKVHSFFTGSSRGLGTFLPSPETLVHYVHLDPFVDAPGPSRRPSAEGATAVQPGVPLTPMTATISTALDGITSPTCTISNPADEPASCPSPPIKSHVSQQWPAASYIPVPVVFYDLDGTLIKTASGNSFPRDRADWTWWHPSVRDRLREEWSAGKHIVVISNQGDSRPKVRAEWRAKVPLIAAKMPADIPFRILAALSKFDVYRKPNIGMFDVVQALYRSRGLDIDVANSVFVGDAAGRAAFKGRAKDHSDTDFKFAINVGLRFLTPEEHFLGQPRPAYPDPPIGFKPSRHAKLAALPPIVPSHTPVAREEVEVVVFVGPPAAGKTSFYRRYFAPRYEHVNQDLLGTRDKCLRTAEELLRAGKAVVIDNTNRNRSTRSHWLDLASRLHLPTRLFHFLCPIDLARHNNMYRACYGPPGEPPRTLLPSSAFLSYANDFEMPMMDEGFDEIRSVNFTFEGSEAARRRWDMYMLEVR